MDLAAFIACKRWVAVLEYIDQLPTACRLSEAMANDPEVAAEVAARPDPTDPWAPRVSEFDLSAIQGRDTVNLLATISQQLVGLAQGKPKQPKLFPGPRTEIDRAIAAMERKHLEDLAGLMGFAPEDLGFVK